MVGPLSPHLPAGYKAFYSLHDLDQGHHGGSAIIISSTLTFTVLPLNYPLEVVAGRLHLQRTFTFCSIYLPPNTPFAREDFTAPLRLLPSPFLLLSDFNGCHQLWGDTVTNRRGVMLATALPISTSGFSTAVKRLTITDPPVRSEEFTNTDYQKRQ